jgi:hypothetical protein
VATRVVGICRRTRSENGGFISVGEVRSILLKEDTLTRQQTANVKSIIIEISEWVLGVRANV